MVLLNIISAALFYFSFPNYFFPSGFPALSWFFAIPLFFALENQTFFRRVCSGIILGLLSYLPLISWVEPIHTTGYLLFVFVLSLQPILFCSLFFPLPQGEGLCRRQRGEGNSRRLSENDLFIQTRVARLKKILNDMYASGISFVSRLVLNKNFLLGRPPSRTIFFNLIYVPALWVFTEFMRAWLLGGFAWTLGNSQAFMPSLIQITNITGSYGVSFIIILVNRCLYQIFFGKKNKIYYGGIIFLIFFVSYGYGQISFLRGDQGGKTKITVCTIQPNISTRDKANPELIDIVFDRHITLSQQCFLAKKPDIVIWPETAVTDDVIRDKIINKKIINFVQEVQTPILVGSALLIDGKDFNSAVLFDKMGKVKNFYHKQKLVPFMEKQFKFGKAAGVFQLSEKSNFGVSICSEDGYPNVFKKMSKKNPEFIAVLLNDAWFNQKAGFMMHLQNSIMRAVEFGFPIVRSANTGWSGYIDEFGRIENLNQGLNRSKIFKIDIFSSERKTFYGKFGDIFAILCGLFVIIIYSVYRLRESVK